MLGRPMLRPDSHSGTLEGFPGFAERSREWGKSTAEVDGRVIAPTQGSFRIGVFERKTMDLSAAFDRVRRQGPAVSTGKRTMAQQR